MLILIIALPDRIITVLIQYVYILYTLSFQAAELKEKAQLVTGESRNLNIPMKLKISAILFIMTWIVTKILNKESDLMIEM